MNQLPTVDARQVSPMLENHCGVGHVFPRKEVLILSHHHFNKPISKFRLGCGAMFVNHPARRREQTFPAALPGLIRDIRILEIKRMIERIKSADCQELSAVYRAGSPTRPKHRQRLDVFVFRPDRIVPEIEEAALKASPSFAGFFAAASLIREEDL